MTALKALDDVVKAELEKIRPLNGFAVLFNNYSAYPGQGTFVITGNINGISIEYRRKHDDNSILEPVTIHNYPDKRRRLNHNQGKK